MLSSRYAPVVALAVLGVVLVGVLGWFFAIKPQVDDAGELLTREDDARVNTDLVEAESAKLDEYAALLASDPGVGESIAVNAPERIDLPTFRARVLRSLVDSRSELVSYDQESTILVDGWVIPPSTLVSNQVAALFQDGPVAETAAADQPEPEATPAPDGEATAGAVSASGWKPVVSPTTVEGPVADGIVMVPFEIVITGTPQEAYNFMVAMSDPADQLFQIFELTQEARSADASPIPGVADAKDGDVITTVHGALYLLNPDPALVDEGELATVGARGDGFVKVGAADRQPGAN